MELKKEDVEIDSRRFRGGKPLYIFNICKFLFAHNKKPASRPKRNKQDKKKPKHMITEFFARTDEATLPTRDEAWVFVFMLSIYIETGAL